MFAGVGLMIAEMFVSAYGVLLVGGMVLFLFGGVMLFDMPDVSDVSVDFWAVLLPAAVGMAAFGGIAVVAIGRTFRKKQTAGVSELIGLVGRASTPLAPAGRVFVRGEYWNARCGEELPVDAAVEVIEVKGMRLRVRRAAGDF